MSTSLPLLDRIAVFVRDRGACVYCGARWPSVKLTVDHVISRKRGGGNAFTNLVCACFSCNRDKAHFSLKAYLVELQDRGMSAADAAAVETRVDAARFALIDWIAVNQASADLKAMAASADDDDA